MLILDTLDLSSLVTSASLRGRCPAVKVLVLTAYDDDAYVQGLAAGGVAGYALKAVS